MDGWMGGWVGAIWWIRCMYHELNEQVGWVGGGWMDGWMEMSDHEIP